jgi:transposase
VGKLLSRWGFTAQKPAFRAFEQDPEQVRKWLQQRYPAIKKRAQKEHGRVFWLDEVGMRSGHQAGTSFAPKGRTPVIEKTGKRFSLNMISAISNAGQLVFMIMDGNFNGAVFVLFLQRLIRYSRQKVFLIADTHPAHIEKKVGQWLGQHKKNIELFFLPTYSPELNPDEYFNQDLKTNLVGKARPRNKEELKVQVKAFANRKKRNPQKVKKYFHPTSVAYAG